jgi:hypothetical protein
MNSSPERVFTSPFKAALRSRSSPEKSILPMLNCSPSSTGMVT